MEKVNVVVNEGKFVIIDGIRFDAGAVIKNLNRSKAEKKAKQGLITILPVPGKPKKK